MKDCNKIEAVLLLEEIAQQRIRALHEIAMQRLWEGENWFLSNQEVFDIEHDNMLTDTAIRKGFLNRSYASPDAPELHVKRCIDSLVEYCICQPDRALQGGIV